MLLYVAVRSCLLFAGACYVAWCLLVALCAAVC